MKSTLAALSAVALLALTGCGAAAEATTPTAEVKPHTVRQVENALDPTADRCEEDEPCWDCKTMGNKICGPNPIERTEAWGAFQTSELPPETLQEAFKVTYRGTAMQGIDLPPAEYVTIPSEITPASVHVFEVETTPATCPANFYLFAGGECIDPASVPSAPTFEPVAPAAAPVAEEVAP